MPDPIRLLARWATRLFLLTAIASSPSQTRQLDRGFDPLLSPLVRRLELRGIDVAVGNTGAIDNTKETRPRVASLKNFVSASALETGTLPWMRGFDEGVLGAFAAVKRGPPLRQDSTASGEDSFLALWSRTPPARRVFVAFARADDHTAADVAAALHEAGYIVFRYIREPGRGPWASSTVVGRLFAQAGHHLVIDSGPGRRSAGVYFEAARTAQLSQELAKLREASSVLQDYRKAHRVPEGSCSDLLSPP